MRLSFRLLVVLGVMLVSTSSIQPALAVQSLPGSFPASQTPDSSAIFEHLAMIVLVTPLLILDSCGSLRNSVVDTRIWGCERTLAPPNPASFHGTVGRLILVSRAIRQEIYERTLHEAICL
jgi:hypothetical protein